MTFDFDERTRLIKDSLPPNGIDPVFPSICQNGDDKKGCALGWHFTIDNGGWPDDIELNYLGLGDGATPVPEPSAAALLLTALITVGIFARRTGGSPLRLRDEHAARRNR